MDHSKRDTLALRFRRIKPAAKIYYALDNNEPAFSLY